MTVYLLYTHYSVLQYGVKCAACVCTQMYCVQASFGPSSFFTSLFSTLPATYLKTLL